MLSDKRGAPTANTNMEVHNTNRTPFPLYDPSAGSPTETLLRLLLPTNKKVQVNFQTSSVLQIHLFVPSVGATGGVYKEQGRNRCKLMTYDY